MKKLIRLVVFLVIFWGLAQLTWMYKTGWLDAFNAEQNQLLKEHSDAGAAFGLVANQQQCLTQALVDIKGCLGFQCTVTTGRFLQACFITASPSVGFCDAVPTFREKLTKDDKAWAKYSCLERNIQSDSCRLLLRQQQLLCSQ